MKNYEETPLHKYKIAADKHAFSACGESSMDLYEGYAHRRQGMVWLLLERKIKWLAMCQSAPESSAAELGLLVKALANRCGQHTLQLSGRVPLIIVVPSVIMQHGTGAIFTRSFALLWHLRSPLEALGKMFQVGFLAYHSYPKWGSRPHARRAERQQNECYRDGQGIEGLCCGL